MFLEHFKMRTQPFVEHAPVNSLWQDPRVEEAQARLTFLIDHGTLGLLTGASGLGKSAMIKRFMHGLSPQHCEAVYCHLTHLPGAGLLRAVLSQLGETPRRGKQLPLQTGEPGVHFNQQVGQGCPEDHIQGDSNHPDHAPDDHQFLYPPGLTVGPAVVEPHQRSTSENTSEGDADKARGDLSV